MAAQPEASTVVWATVEASTAVVARLLEAATEVATTVAESTRSIQLNPAKSKRASWPTLRLAQLRLSLSSPRLNSLGFPHAFLDWRVRARDAFQP